MQVKGFPKLLKNLSILESNISGYSRVLRVTLGEVMGGAGDMGQYTTLTYVH